MHPCHGMLAPCVNTAIVPAGHAVHAASPWLMCPGSHLLHVVNGAHDDLPTLQAPHEVHPVPPMYVPLVRHVVLQLVAPPTSEYVPASQYKHAVLAASAAYIPALHCSQESVLAWPFPFPAMGA